MFPLSTIIEVKPLQYTKALSPIETTLLGIVKDSMLLHLYKTALPMEVIVSGKMILFKSVHSLKAFEGIISNPEKYFNSLKDVIVLL